MKILTSNENLDMITDLDKLHPARQIEECERIKENDVTITTYSTYILEWAFIRGIEIVGCPTKDIFMPATMAFDIIDKIKIDDFTK